jgi:hypothetical protein
LKTERFAPPNAVAGPFSISFDTRARGRILVSIPPEKIADLRFKQLEMVQGIVSRMAGYGVNFKSYCITVTTAVCGFAITLQRPVVSLLALLPIASFALIDAQYLRLERRFRRLFDSIRSEDWEAIPSFKIDLRTAPFVPYFGTLCSWSIVAFYAPLALGVAIVVLIARCIYGLGL